MAQASYTAGLTPAMRAALAANRPGAGLRGLAHGATLNALVRHGLAYFSNWLTDDWDAYLTDVGLAAREELHGRVEEKLAAHGFTPSRSPGLYNNPDEGGTCTRAGAMRRTGVRW